MRHVVTIAKHRKHHTRLIAKQTGRTYQGAARLIANPDTPPPIAGRRDTPHPTGITWTQLIGIQVTADTFTGIVLPGVDPHHPELLRLHLTGNNEVVQFNPAWFTITPMPDDVHLPPKGSRRRTHCPAGRPIYRPGELPGDILATQTMLKHLRRRVPDSLTPIASYLGGRGGSSYHPLWAVTDCTPLPAQTPKQQATWAKTRTCAWCTATSTYPLNKLYTNTAATSWLRLCGPCLRSNIDQRNEADRNARRLRAENQARILLDSLATAIVVKQTSTEHHDTTRTDHNLVTAVDHQGNPIGEYRYTYHWDDGRGRDPDQAMRDTCRRMRDDLANRWIIDLTDPSRLTVASDIREATEGPWLNPGPADVDRPQGWNRELGGSIIRIAGDARGPIPVLAWPAGQYPADYKQIRDRHIHRTVTGDTDPPADPARMWWEVLDAVANKPHPHGPARCPHRGSHSQPACGSAELTSAGFCREHAGG